MFRGIVTAVEAGFHLGNVQSKKQGASDALFKVISLVCVFLSKKARQRVIVLVIPLSVENLTLIERCLRVNKGANHSVSLNHQ